MTLFHVVLSLGACYVDQAGLDLTEFCLRSAEIKGEYHQVWLSHFLKWTHSCFNKQKAEGSHLKNSLSQHLGFWTTLLKERKRILIVTVSSVSLESSSGYSRHVGTGQKLCRSDCYSLLPMTPPILSVTVTFCYKLGLSLPERLFQDSPVFVFEGDTLRRWRSQRGQLCFVCEPCSLSLWLRVLYFTRYRQHSHRTLFSVSLCISSLLVIAVSLCKSLT